MFKRHPEVKEQPIGSGLWSDGYLINTVKKFVDENTITEYVKKQGITG